ncbi:heparan-alpha-glucosaminide N-acetyltransferase domain-containing protein [Kocuria dechangensis]|uniref:heparan-alpha-glucosaminide N-acetyltransferase domain-containing protein n=1 Tax=Kocuria dechangensis TaxID=1176249 RepID=UPI0016678509|nr:heparan-alpha-glucosaminide N-acetyltransferase domain-containing protein [Kocuria dechangensis]
MAVPSVDPLQAKARVVGVDAVRGIALIGIMAVHVLPATVHGAPSLTWLVLAGRAAALFALLAGISIAFLSGAERRLTGRNLLAARAALIVRALLIVVFGLLLGYMESSNLVILTYYGIMFFLAVPLIGLRTRWLLVTALVSTIVCPVLMQVVRYRDDLQQVQVPDYTFGGVLAHPGRFIEDMLLTGGYPALPWMAYICVGMAVGRLPRLMSRRAALMLLLGGGVLAVTGWAISAVLLGPGGGFDQLVRSTPGSNEREVADILVFGPDPALPTTTWWWLAILAPYSTTPLHILHTLGTALAIVGSGLLAAKYARPLLLPLSLMGTMTLTLYSAHIVIEAVDLLDGYRSVVSLAIQVGLFIGFAVLWRRSVGKGPLEGLVAFVTGWVRKRLAPSASTRVPAERWI